MRQFEGRIPGPIGRDPFHVKDNKGPGPGNFRAAGVIQGKGAPQPTPSTLAAGLAESLDPLPAIIPKITVGRVLRGNPYVPKDASDSGMPDSVPPTKSYEVVVTVDPPLVGTGLFVEVFVVNSGGAGGEATVTPPQITRTTRVQVTGITQTQAGNAGRLQIMARLAGTGIAARSPGFSVCAHPSGIRAILFKDLDDPKASKFGIIVKHDTESDSGKLSDLDEVQMSEIIDQFRHDEPPFKRGSGVFTGAGSAGDQVNDLQFLPAIPPSGKFAGDTHSEARPDPGPAGQAEYLQVQVFKCARCGVPPVSLPKSGFDILFRVFQLKVGGPFQYEIKKVGALIGVSFRGKSFKATAGAANIRVTHGLP